MKKIILGILMLLSFAFVPISLVQATPSPSSPETDLARIPILSRESSTGFPNLGQVVPVTLDIYFDPTNPSPTHFNLEKNYGSKVSMASYLGGPSGYVFSFWIVNGFVRPELPYDYSFVITESLALIAVYRPTADKTVCFMDSNNKLIQWQYSTAADPFTSADVPSVAGYSKPGYEVAALPWGSAIDFDNILTDTIAMLHYTPAASPGTYTVSVENGSGDGTYAFDTVVTVVADTIPDKYFGGWEDGNGKLLSTQTTYSFTVVGNTTLTARFFDSPAGEGNFPILTLSQPLYLRDGKVTFVGQFYLPEGFDLIEYGITLVDNDQNETQYKASNLNPLTGEFVMTFPEAELTYATPYLIFVDPANPTYWQMVMSDDTDIPLLPVHPIISEYGEGSSNNKWIEIYNPSNLVEIDLSKYSLKLYLNGASSPSQSLTLSGLLDSGDVYVIANGSASTEIKEKADLLNSTVINFNGDDAVGLFYQSSSSPIDLFGIPNGTDPGDFWNCGVGTTKDNTIYRNFGIDVPAAVWDTSEWSVLSVDDISKLGFHENDNPTSVEWTGSHSIMAGNTAQLTVSYIPLDARRGVTWSVTDNNPNDGSGNVLSVDANGLVTALEAGTAVVVCTSSVTPSIYYASAISVTAPVYYDVNASAENEAHGTVSASPTSVLGGGSSTITITPSSGYYTDYITVNGVVTQLDGTNTFTISNIYATQTAVVTFDALNTISVSSNNNDYGTASASPTAVMDGGSSTISFTPATGYVADTITINGGDPISLNGASSYPLNSISSNQTILVTFVASSGSTETLIYSTGFESSEGFVSSTTYNNQTVSYKGPTGQQWGTYYGTPSTTSPIAGSQSMQMRWYSSAPLNKGYSFTNFTLTDVTKVEFVAKNTSTINVTVSYSTDGGTNYVNPQTFTLSTTATTYTYDVSSTGLDVMIKFEISFSTTPVDTSRLIIDTIKIYGLR
jgi:hypothetical protein